MDLKKGVLRVSVILFDFLFVLEVKTKAFSKRASLLLTKRSGEGGSAEGFSF